MKTWVCTRPSDEGENGWRNKCIWKGEFDHILRAGDMIQLYDGFAVETIETVYIGIHDNTMEIQITGSDMDNEYPDVGFPK